MAVVLAEAGDWMSRDELAAQIARRRLWVRPSDGQPPPSDQLRLRARNYPHLFECSDASCTRIRLRTPATATAEPRRPSEPPPAPDVDVDLGAASERRRAAARRYRPDEVRLLLVADSPPRALDRYFYFEDVATQDSLFRYVVRAVLGVEPDRRLKASHLQSLRDAGVYVIDLRPEPDDSRRSGSFVPDLIATVRALDPACVILIKATVYDAAYRSLNEAGVPVAPHRIPFPGSGRQTEFMEAMADALTWCAARHGRRP